MPMMQVRPMRVGVCELVVMMRVGMPRRMRESRMHVLQGLHHQAPRAGYRPRDFLMTTDAMIRIARPAKMMV